MRLCDYGCGREAKYQFKNGKWCCENNISKCEKIRERNLGKTVCKPVIVYNEKLCDFGCGEKAKYKFKNGKLCCSKSPNTCKSLRLKNSKSNKNLVKIIEILEFNNVLNLLCDYGCGKIAKYRIGKQKKICCTNNPKKCPSIIEKYRKVAKNRTFSKNTIEKMSKSKLGKKDTLETRNKKRQARIGRKNPNYGKNHSKETKRKIRLAHIKAIKNRCGQITPNYNIKGCKIIDKYGKEHGYNFQHAENGGEFYIKELGYWVDGYDKKKNVVIEIDESFHYNLNGKLKERDIQRQKEITDLLKCKFIRIKIDKWKSKNGD